MARLETDSNSGYMQVLSTDISRHFELVSAFKTKVQMVVSINGMPVRLWDPCCLM